LDLEVDVQAVSNHRIEEHSFYIGIGIPDRLGVFDVGEQLVKVL